MLVDMLMLLLKVWTVVAGRPTSHSPGSQANINVAMGGLAVTSLDGREEAKTGAAREPACAVLMIAGFSLIPVQVRIQSGGSDCCAS